MKVTASEVFKGKKANYTTSIPKPFMPHRLGERGLDVAAVCVQCVLFFLVVSDYSFLFSFCACRYYTGSAEAKCLCKQADCSVI